MYAKPRLAVVVGTLNRLDLLKLCVESILQRTRTPVVLYVTDAGSDDGTIEYLKSVDDERLQCVFVGKKLGQAKAYNDVFRTLDAEYVCWLSDDNEVVEGALDDAVAILDQDPSIGMVGLKVRDVVGPFVKAPYIGGISETGVLNVNQGVLRTDLFRRLGFFSEVFGFYGIDPDLTAKVLYSGADVVYTRKVAVLHRRNWPSDRDSPVWKAIDDNQKRAMALYRRKYGRLGAADLGWRVKKALWSAVRPLVWRGWKINGSEPLLGQLPRDWHNMFSARHVSVLDGLKSRGKLYHLRQHVGVLARPRVALDDEALIGFDADAAVGRAA